MTTELTQFIENIDNDVKKVDSQALLTLFTNVTGFDAYLTGSIIGFGQYHYQYASGREGDSIVTGFSPRKQNIALYIMPGFAEIEPLLARLGKHKIGKSCLYINKLADIDTEVLALIIAQAVETMRAKYPCINVKQ